MDKEQLMSLAVEARDLSYSPYSHFAVGAALLCRDGTVYVGANIETSAYSHCVCAERNAIYNAMMHGKTADDFAALAVVADTEGPCTPCGACRQVFAEFFADDMPIYMGNLEGDIQETTIKELLPYAFSGDVL